jgi:acetyltransferase-like isoleucine patch superfamily enzyme
MTVDTALTPHGTGRWFRILWTLFRSMPNRWGRKPRVILLRRAGATVGDRVTIGARVTVLGPQGLVIEDGVGVARDALLDARGGIVLKQGCMVGFESILLTWTHAYDDPYTRIADQGSIGAPITIGPSAWLGGRTVVLPGLVVGDSSIVGIGSIVTRSVEPNMIVAGNPAREIRSR